jgi:hypothetical protein
MFRAKGTSISLRDLRIAKLQKRMRITACGPELDTFLAAVAAASGNEDKVPAFVKKALSNCMEESVRSLHLLFNCCFCCRTRSHCTYMYLHPIVSQKSEGKAQGCFRGVSRGQTRKKKVGWISMIQRYRGLRSRHLPHPYMLHTTLRRILVQLRHLRYLPGGFKTARLPSSSRPASTWATR